MTPLFLLILMVLGSLVFGWPALVILSFLFGLGTKQKHSSLVSALTATGSWSLLLTWRFFNGTLPTLLQSFEDIINIPGWILILITLSLAAVLGSAGANLGQQIQTVLQKQFGTISG